jgi:predicted  nucleic acid-binding Zn ribbon protein
MFKLSTNVFVALEFIFNFFYNSILVRILSIAACAMYALVKKMKESIMLKNIQQVFDITKEIEKLSLQEEWQRVEQLQLNRAKLIQQTELLNAPKDESSSLEIERLVMEIQKIDALMMPKITAQIQALANERKQASKGAKMTKAYQSS